jgi:hypothetical protein
LDTRARDRLPRAFTIAGEGLWSVVYLAALVVGWRDGISAIPPAAIILNFAWEILFFRRVPKGDRVRQALYGSWLALDVALFAQLFWLRPGAELPAFVHENLALSLVFGLTAALAIHRLVDSRVRHPTGQAFALNLVMSALFIHMFFVRTDGAGLSITIACLKCAGTGLISVANSIAWLRSGRVDWFGPPVMVTIFVLDAAYVALLLR